MTAGDQSGRKRGSGLEKESPGGQRHHRQRGESDLRVEAAVRGC